MTRTSMKGFRARAAEQHREKLTRYADGGSIVDRTAAVLGDTAPNPVTFAIGDTSPEIGTLVANRLGRTAPIIASRKAKD